MSELTVEVNPAAVGLDPERLAALYTPGPNGSAAFWVGQQADLTVSFFTQLLPSSVHPIRSELRQLVYQALTD